MNIMKESVIEKRYFFKEMFIILINKLFYIIFNCCESPQC